MSDMSPASAQILDWATTARLDRDVETLAGERAEFQRRTAAMTAAWQPVPPSMILGFAHRLSQWIEYFGQYEGDAEKLAGAGRPAVRQRLNEIVGELRREVPIHQQSAGQGAAQPRGLASTPSASDAEAAKKLRETQAETDRIMADTRAATEAAGARRIDMYSNALLGRCQVCNGTGRIGYNRGCVACGGTGRGD